MPDIPPWVSFGGQRAYAPFLHLINSTDIIVDGSGVLDGNGSCFWSHQSGHHTDLHFERPRLMVCMYVCMCVCMCVYVCVCVCMCVYVRVYVYVRMCACVHVCTFVYAHVCMYVCMCVFLYVCMYVSVHMCM